MRRRVLLVGSALVLLVSLVLVASARSGDDDASGGASPPATTPATTTSVIEIPPVVIAEATPGAGFPDGVWSGVIVADTSLLTIPDLASATTSDIYGTFLFTVEDGFGTGTYVMTATQIIEAGEDGAAGETVINGVMEGPSVAPSLLAALFSFSGTITMDGVTQPFVFEQPLEPTTAVPEWVFETVTPTFVWGTVNLDDLVAATEAANGIDFSDNTTLFAAVPGEETDFDALVERVRELASIEG